MALSVRNRHFRHLISILSGIGLFWCLFAAASTLGGTQRASAASDPVIAAAGDIACDPSNASFNGGLGTSGSCRQKYTSDLLVNTGLSAVLDLGDNQYYCGGYSAFLQSYDLSWGRLKSITHPSVGNHEYLTSGGTGCDTTNEGAAGYYQYFGLAAGASGQGWYSFDVGNWHIIALNSNCGDAGGCGSGSPQYTWLQSDLAGHANYCTLAYWHIPLFSSGGRAASNSKPFWQLLYNNDADVILNGHDHIYERFAPQNPTGGLDTARGIRQFTVGTGGANHTTITTVAANSEVRNADTFGVLRLTLHASSYSWQFSPESGKTFTDSGSANCHGTNPPTATATGLSATLTMTTTATPSPLPTATSSGVAGSSLTLAPQADAHVSSSNPTTNYGTGTTLRADGSPDVHSYVRFSVPGLNGAPITRARLMLYMNSSSSSTLNALAVANNTWGETTVTYSTAPALGSRIATSGTLATGTLVTLDVTSYVAGPGTYSFGITTPGSTAVSLGSRESGAHAPQLILDLGTTSTPSPTATNTAIPTATATATRSPTPAPTRSPTPTATLPPPATNTATFTSTATLVLPSTTPSPTATPSPLPTPTTTQVTGQSVTFVPQADAYVDASNPATNYGMGTTLRADGSPDVHSYVRFNVSGLNGVPITRARLLFYMNSASSAGMKALAVADNTWAETTVNYNSAPALGSTLATSGALTTGTWVTLDVSSYVNAERSYNFGVLTPGSTAISFGSRESGAHAPQLIVELSP